MVHVISPFSLEKDLGKAYNKCISLLPDSDWVCLHDYDTLFLTPDAVKMMDEYTKLYPDTGIFTCFTNRLHHLAIDQLLNGKVSENTDVKYHMELAYNQKRHFPTVTEIKHEISGFLMLISKKTWNEIKFNQNSKCLGVDNDYSLRILSAGKKILRMDAIYVFHLYRLMNGVANKEHLK